MAQSEARDMMSLEAFWRHNATNILDTSDYVIFMCRANSNAE